MKTKIFDIRYLIIIPLLSSAFSSCFPALEPTDADAMNAEGGNVMISANISIEQQQMTRAAVSDYAQALSIFVYDEDGAKVAGASHRVGDTGFGQLNARLGEGTYTAVAVAHNAASGNATSTTIGKVTVPDNRVTDTFHASSVFDIIDEESQHISLELNRCVAMLRAVSSNNPPEGTRQVKLYYTGGSSTLNGDTGYGAVNSRQTVVFDANDNETLRNESGNSVYEVYTFPHTDEDVLKLTLSCLDENGDVLCERTIEDIPVRVSYITTLTGALFAETGNTSVDISITIGNNTWGNIVVSY